MHNRKRLCAFLVAAALTLGCLLSAGGAEAADQGREIEAADLLGMIRAERGKVVVVNFFASWCPPCREEIPDLIALRDSVSKEDVTLVGVSVDEDPGQLGTMLQHVAFNYPVYRGVGDLPGVFAISSIPRLLIYDPKGTLVIDHVGIADPAALAAKIEELKGN